MNNSKGRSIVLSIFCFIGLGLCFVANKYGPIPLALPSQAAPPGWTPPQQQQQQQAQAQPQQKQTQPQQQKKQQQQNEHS